MKFLSRATLLACTVATASTFLTGCASSFNVGEAELSCPGGVGIPCTDARTVHERTNNMQPGDSRRGLSGSTESSVTGAKVAVAPFYSKPIPNYPSIDHPMPVMAGAQVMRIWVNAWLDNRGDLVYPSYVFTEVTPRRWNVGNSTARGISTKRVSPLFIEPTPDAATNDVVTPSTAAVNPNLTSAFTSALAASPGAAAATPARTTKPATTIAPALKKGNSNQSVVPPLILPN